ncbi:MAG: hypothetical protein IJW67_00105, partial [Blautia sp.]|nr:hypothetical protein [Blautia sp.]
MRVHDFIVRRLAEKTLLGITGAVFLLALTTTGVFAAEPEKTLTVVYHDYGNNAVIRQWFERAYESFGRKDEFKLNIRPVTSSESDYTILVARSLQSPDTAPDLFCEDTFLLPADVEAGYL